METGDSVHEHRPTGNQCKLFGHGQPHAQSLSAGNNDYIVHNAVINNIYCPISCE